MENFPSPYYSNPPSIGDQRVHFPGVFGKIVLLKTSENPWKNVFSRDLFKLFELSNLSSFHLICALLYHLHQYWKLTLQQMFLVSVPRMPKIAARASVSELLYSKLTRNFKNSLLTGVAGSQFIGCKTTKIKSGPTRCFENFQKCTGRDL